MTSISKKVFIDLETYSPVDLQKRGVYVYTNHPDFRIVCAALIYDDKKIILEKHHEIYKKVKTLRSKGYKFVAHNAAFEYLCLKDATDPEDWECTMVLSSYYTGVTGLRFCAVYWGLEEQKMILGKQYIRWVIKNYNTKSETPLDTTHPNYKNLLKYCLQDTKTHKKLYEKIINMFGDIPEKEKLYFWDTLKLIKKKVPIDIHTIYKLIDIRNRYAEIISKKFKSLYNFNPRSYTQVIKWCANNGYKTNETGKGFFIREAHNMPKDVRNMFKLKHSTPSAVLAKLEYFLHEEITPSLKHFGAYTGRYTSQGINILNLPHGKYDEDILSKSTDTIIKEHKLDTSNYIKQNIRPCIIAPDNKLICAADYSQVEFRLLMWFVGHKKIVQELNSGVDIYIDFANKIWPNKKIDKGSIERHIAKICVLALGYGLGRKSLHRKILESQPTFNINDTYKAYNEYHEAFPNVEKFHDLLDEKIINSEQFVTLPNGRKLLIKDIDPDVPNGLIRKIVSGRVDLRMNYGSAICGRYIQSTARELLFEKQHELIDKGYDVCFNVYDEIVAFVESDKQAQEIKEIMSVNPLWLPDIPLNVETTVSKRYDK